MWFSYPIRWCANVHSIYQKRTMYVDGLKESMSTLLALLWDRYRESNYLGVVKVSPEQNSVRASVNELTKGGGLPATLNCDKDHKNGKGPPISLEDESPSQTKYEDGNSNAPVCWTGLFQDGADNQATSTSIWMVFLYLPHISKPITCQVTKDPSIKLSCWCMGTII